MSSRPTDRKMTFRHPRLSSARSIRLLDLHPATDFTLNLEVELFEICLDSVAADEQQYEALSYVWGVQSGTKPVACHGRRLFVTPNCESALRHLRMPELHRLLWVDAICINQEENDQGFEERNTQVPLMGEIYAKAIRTICWLGDGISFTGEVIRHLDNIGRCPSQRGLAKLMRFERQLHKNKILDDESSCLDHIFCHPWHSRIWTVQEVAYSNDCLVICGKSSLSWDEYRTAAEFLIYEQFIESLSLQAAKSMVSIDMRNVLRRYLRNLPYRPEDEEVNRDPQDRQVVFLTSCLTDVNQLRATDPKDKVYGLYAIYTSLGIPMPPVDYRKTLSDVYEGAALAMIAWSGSLRVLRDACSVTRHHTLASWVPDWNDAEVRLFMPDSRATKGSRIADTKLIAISPAQKKLRVRGTIAGEIVDMGGEAAMMPFPTRSDTCTLSILSDASFHAVEDVDFLRLLVDKIKFFRELLHFLRTNQHLCQADEPTDIFYEILTLGEGSPHDDAFDTLIDVLAYPESKCDQSFGHMLAMDWKAADTANAARWTSELMHCVTIAASLLSGSIQRDGAGFPSHSAILDLVKDVAEHLGDQTVILVKTGPPARELPATTFRSAAAGDLVVLLE